MRTVRLEEARGALGDLIDRARLAAEPTLITRYNRPAAVVVSEEWYRNAIVVLDTLLPQDLGYREVRPSERPDWEAGESAS